MIGKPRLLAALVKRGIDRFLTPKLILIKRDSILLMEFASLVAGCHGSNLLHFG
jgi:hypothetical protein